MKKIFLLLTVAVLVSSVGSVQISAATSSSGTAVTQVPGRVMAAYIQTVNDIVTSNFGENIDWEDSNIVWDKDRNVWIASGRVLVVGGNGAGIRIQSARFANNGDVQELLYTVIPYPTLTAK